MKKNKTPKNKETESEPKYQSGTSPICISLCLEEFIKGLHVDFIVTKEGEEQGSFITLSLNDEPIAFYKMGWSERIHPEDALLDINAKLLLGEPFAEPLTNLNNDLG